MVESLTLGRDDRAAPTRLAVLMVLAERPASEGNRAAAGSIALAAAAFLDHRRYLCPGVF